jgi:hypothetical protein
MVLNLWEEMGRFPISFVPMLGLVDKTDNVIEKMNQHTKRVANVFVNLTTTEGRMDNSLMNLFKAIKMRGILTILGVRKTNGS